MLWSFRILKFYLQHHWNTKSNDLQFKCKQRLKRKNPHIQLLTSWMTLRIWLTVYSWSHCVFKGKHNQFKYQLIMNCFKVVTAINLVFFIYIDSLVSNGTTLITLLVSSVVCTQSGCSICRITPLAGFAVQLSVHSGDVHSLLMVTPRPNITSRIFT